MKEITAETYLAKLLSVGSALITVFLISGSVTDPVNAPKLLVLGIVAFSTFSILLFSKLRFRLSAQKIPIIFLLFFVVALLSAVISSNSPVSQNIYGVYGRNNGLLAYILLVLLFIVTLSLRIMKSFDSIIQALHFSGILNLIYCFWVIAFGDFVGWSNPYGNILGTFGNPNFIGSFLGIFFGTLLAYTLKTPRSNLFKYLSLLGLLLCAFEIYKSNAIQGRVVAAVGVAIVLFYFIRSKFRNLLLITYTIISLVLGGLALLGTLQKGPFADFLYKTSVSLRGQYWLAAWNTGKLHPYSGVGMDAFGDWYRRMRDPHALDLPGVNTVVNAAHNVPLDMFAFGGWPLFVSYLALTSLVVVSIVKYSIRNKNYDPIFVSLTVSWVGYQVQSIISINQIGLAIWGWILSGSLLSYSRKNLEETARIESQQQPKVKRTLVTNRQTQPHIPVVATIAGIIGFLVALPPFSADAKWRSAQVRQSANLIESSLQASYFNPPNSTKYLLTIQIFEQNRLFDLSHEYALQAVKWNPEAFELWKVLYLIQNSTSVERELALANMKRLDPLNPDVAAR